MSLAGATIALVHPTPADEFVLPLTRDAVHGSIDITSFGVALLAADDGQPIAAVHVREVVANRDKIAWTIDAQTMTLAFGDALPVAHPLFVNSDAPTVPIVIVDPGQRRVVDFYFAVPRKLFGVVPGELSLGYTLNTPDDHFAARAILVRRGAPPLEQLAPRAGFGENWWADPAFAWSSYYHRPGFAVPRPPKQVEVTTAPRSFYEAVPADEDQWPRTDECDDW